jgi:lysylphosphatidylglycerol synthetase-like protein (DUF2156 family)
VSDDNPYSPPEADIGDGDRARVLRARPSQIVQAIALLWISASLGLWAGLLQAQRGQDATDAIVVMVVETLVLLGVLTFAIWRGRNWGRILYVFLVALSLAAFLDTWGTEQPTVDVALEAVSFVADAGAFFLMFTKPGSLWFTYTREPRV